ARVEGVRGTQRTRQQPRRDQQHRAKGNLCADERASQPTPSTSCPCTVLFHHRVDIAFRCLERRDQTKGERRHGGKRKRETQDCPIGGRINSHKVGIWNRGEKRRQQRFEEPPEQ